MSISISAHNNSFTLDKNDSINDKLLTYVYYCYLLYNVNLVERCC